MKLDRLGEEQVREGRFVFEGRDRHVNCVIELESGKAMAVTPEQFAKLMTQVAAGNKTPTVGLYLEDE